MARPDVFDSLDALAGMEGDTARQSYEEAQRPYETPALTQQRVGQQAQQRVQYGRVKAEDLSRRGIAYDITSRGDAREVTDSTGSPLTNADKAGKIAYDTSGRPVDYSQRDVTGKPVVRDAYEGIPEQTDPKTGDTYKVRDRLPWLWTGEDPRIKAQIQEKAVQKLNSRTYTALAGEETDLNAQARSDAKAAKNSAKSTLGAMDAEMPGEQFDLNADEPTLRAQVETAYNQEYGSKRANEKPWFGGGKLSPSAEAYRREIDARKAQTLANLDQHLAVQKQAQASATALQTIQEQRRGLRTDRLADINEERAAAGLPAVGLASGTQPQESQGRSEEPSDQPTTLQHPQQPSVEPADQQTSSLEPSATSLSEQSLEGSSSSSEQPTEPQGQEQAQHPAATLYDRAKNFLTSIVGGAAAATGDIIKSPVGKLAEASASLGTQPLMEYLSGLPIGSTSEQHAAALQKVPGVITDPAFHDNGEAKAGRFIGGVIPYLAQTAIAPEATIPLLFSVGYQGQHDAAMEELSKRSPAAAASFRGEQVDPAEQAAWEAKAQETALKSGLLGGAVNSVLGIPFAGAGKVISSLFGKASTSAVETAFNKAYQAEGAIGVANLLAAWRAAVDASGIVPDAFKAAAQQGLIGVIKEITKTALQRVGSVATTAARDAAIFGGTTIGQNIIAQQQYDPNQSLTEGAGEAAIGGMVLGGLFGGVREVKGARAAEQARADFAKAGQKPGEPPTGETGQPPTEPPQLPPNEPTTTPESPAPAPSVEAPQQPVSGNPEAAPAETPVAVAPDIELPAREKELEALSKDAPPWQRDLIKGRIRELQSQITEGQQAAPQAQPVVQQPLVQESGQTANPQTHPVSPVETPSVQDAPAESQSVAPVPSEPATPNTEGASGPTGEQGLSLEPSLLPPEPASSSSSQTVRAGGSSPEPIAPTPATQPRIVGPALVQNGTVLAQGKIGETHGQLKVAAAKQGIDATEAEHAFVDDQGRILNREQAAQIAEAAGQRRAGKGPLHSQHLSSVTDPAPVESRPQPEPVAAQERQPADAALVSGTRAGGAKTPNPELQKKFTDATGERMSVAAVQHLMEFKRQGMSDDEAIDATIGAFNKSPVGPKIKRISSAPAKAPEPAQPDNEMNVSAPVPASAREVLNGSAKVKLTVPKGARFLRVTDSKGRQIIEGIENVTKGANVFHGAGPFKKVEAGLYNSRKEFVPIKGEIEAVDLNKPQPETPNAVNEKQIETSRGAEHQDRDEGRKAPATSGGDSPVSPKESAGPKALPVSAEATNVTKLAKATIASRRGELDALEHPAQFDIGDTQGNSGIEVNQQTGHITIDPEKYASAVEAAARISPNPNKGNARLEFIRNSIGEEIEHLKTLAFERSEPHNRTRIEALNENEPEIADSLSKNYNGWKDLNRQQKGHEIFRAILQARNDPDAPRPTTESTYRLIADFIAWLKKHVEQLKGDTLKMVGELEVMLERLKKAKRPPTEPTKENGPSIAAAEPRRDSIVARYEREIADSIEKDKAVVDHYPAEEEDGTPESWRVYSAAKGNNNEATIFKTEAGKFDVSNERGMSLGMYEDTLEDAVSTARDYVQSAGTEESRDVELAARQDILHTVNVPKGVKLLDAQDTKWGSVYYKFRVGDEVDKDGEPVNYEDYKVSIRNHEPSPFREKEFGRNDYWVEVPQNATPQQLSDAVSKVEDWIARKSGTPIAAVKPELEEAFYSQLSRTTGGSKLKPETLALWKRLIRPEDKGIKNDSKTEQFFDNHEISTSPKGETTVSFEHNPRPKEVQVSSANGITHFAEEKGQKGYRTHRFVTDDGNSELVVNEHSPYDSKTESYDYVNPSKAAITLAFTKRDARRKGGIEKLISAADNALSVPLSPDYLNSPEMVGVMRKMMGEIPSAPSSAPQFPLFAASPASEAGAEGKPENVKAQAARLWNEKGTDSPFFKKWFGESKVVDEKGNPLVVYSGHSNAVLYGNTYKPNKGTAGGFYATEDPAIASRYAEGKVGGQGETFEHGSQYRFKLKNGTFGKKIWQEELTPEQEQKAREFLSDPETGIGTDIDKYINDNAPYDAVARSLKYRGLKDLGAIHDVMESLGHTIAYQKKDPTGNLKPSERQNKNSFEELLDHLGIPWTSYDWITPGVMPLYLRIKNPLDSELPLPDGLMRTLKEAAARSRETANPNDTHWTKDYPLKQWVADIEAGDEYWTTHIPKKALVILKQFGYDGIKEIGQKGEKDRSKRQINWIAFDPEQIKSATGNSGEFDASKPSMLAAAVPSPTSLPNKIDSVLDRVVKGGRWFWEGTADTLERAGYSDLAKQVKQQFDTEHREYGATWKPLREALGDDKAKQKIAKTEWEQYFKDRENGRAAKADTDLKGFSPEGKKLVEAWKEVAVDTGKTLTKLGVEVKDGEKWRPVGNLGEKFFPRKLNQKTMDVLQAPEKHPKEWAQLVQDLIYNGNIKDASEADKFLKQYVWHEDSTNDYYANIEQARKAKLPESWLDYKFDEIAPWYVTHFARRVGQIEAYGQEHKDGDLFDKTLATIPKRKDYQFTQEYIKAAKDAAYFRNDNTSLANAFRNLQQFATGAFLSNPMSAIRNVVSGVSQVGVQYGTASTLKAAWDTLMDLKGKVDQSKDMGILKDDLAQMMMETREIQENKVQRGVRKAVNIGLTATGFNLAENFARATAMTAAKTFARKSAEEMNKSWDSSASKQAQAFFIRHGIDPTKIAAEKGTGPETNRFTRASVRESQGGYNFDQVPLYQTMPVIKFVTQFAKWGTMMARFLVKHAINPAVFGTDIGGGRKVRTLKPLLLAAAFAIGGGELLYYIKELLTGRGGPDASLSETQNALDQNQKEGISQIGSRLFSDVIQAGTLGIFSDYAGNLREFATRGRFKNPFDPPGVQAFKNIFSVLASLKQQGTLTGKDIWDTVKNQFPGAKFAEDVTDRVTGDALKKAVNTQSQARLAGMRMAKELDLPVQAPFSAALPVKTPKTPLYSAIGDALLTGDVAAARKTWGDYLKTLKTPAERDKAQASLKASVTQHQPIKVGGISSAENVSKFARWASTRLPPEQFRDIMALQGRYWATAARAGLVQSAPVAKPPMLKPASSPASKNRAFVFK